MNPEDTVLSETSLSQRINTVGLYYVRSLEESESQRHAAQRARLRSGKAAPLSQHSGPSLPGEQRTESNFVLSRSVGIRRTSDFSPVVLRIGQIRRKRSQHINAGPPACQAPREDEALPRRFTDVETGAGRWLIPFQATFLRSKTPRAFLRKR